MSTEDKWMRYSQLFQNSWEATESQLELLKLCKANLELAKVIHFHFREFSIDWMHKKIPALDNDTPLECLSSPEGINKLKSCLMGMH